MCHLSKKDQYVCQINQGIAEAVTCLLGGAQFSSCPFYHPRSSRGRFGHPREAAVCAGNFPDASGISDYFKRQKCSHKTEPVPRFSQAETHALYDVCFISCSVFFTTRHLQSTHAEDRCQQAFISSKI